MVQRIKTFTASGLFGVPHGVTSIKVEAIGGGAGSGGGNFGDQKGGGGGGGAYAAELTLAVTPGTMFTVTVGAAGGNNSNGGDSSFGSSVIAKGGTTANTPPSGPGPGGAGGLASASTGTIKFNGGNGAAATSTTGGGGGGGAGPGGAGGNASGTTAGVGQSPGGNGGIGGPNGQAGTAGSIYGGGGGGGAGGNLQRAGAAGVVIVTYEETQVGLLPPQILDTEVTSELGGTNPIVNLPSYAEGNVITLECGIHSGGAQTLSTPAGWRLVSQYNAGASWARHYVFARKMTADDVSGGVTTVTLTASASVSTGCIARTWDHLTMASGTPADFETGAANTNLNCANIAPSWGAIDVHTAFIATIVTRQLNALTVTAWPTGYDLDQRQALASGSDLVAASSGKTALAISDDPSSYSVSSGIDCGSRGYAIRGLIYGEPSSGGGGGGSTPPPPPPPVDVFNPGKGHGKGGVHGGGGSGGSGGGGNHGLDPPGGGHGQGGLGGGNPGGGIGEPPDPPGPRPSTPSRHGLHGVVQPKRRLGGGLYG